MTIIQILYIIAGIISIGAGIPQLLKLVAIKDSGEFSFGTWAIWLCTQMVSTVYFFTLGDMLAITIATAWTTFYASMLGLIIYYRPRKTAQLEVAEQRVYR